MFKLQLTRNNNFPNYLMEEAADSTQTLLLIRHSIPVNIDHKSQNISVPVRTLLQDPHISAYPACKLQRISDKSKGEKRRSGLICNLLSWRLKSINAWEKISASIFILGVCTGMPRKFSVFLPN